MADPQEQDWGVGPTDTVEIIIISACLRVEFMNFSMTHDIVAFNNVWGLGNAIPLVEGGDRLYVSE